MRIVRTDEPFEDAAPRRRLSTLGDHEILEPHGDTEQGRQPLESRGTVAAGRGQARISSIRRHERRLRVHREPGVQLAVTPRDGREVRLEELDRTELTVPQTAAHLMRAQTRQRQIGSHVCAQSRCEASMTAGTTK